MNKTILLFFVFLISCRDSNEPEPLRAPGFVPPSIPGIIIRDDLGRWMGRFGNPSEFKSIPGECPDTAQVVILPKKYDIGPAFPMPSNRSFTVQYDLPCNAKVSIWIVRGYYEGGTSPYSFGNATLMSPGGLAVKTIMQDEPKDAGRYAFSWSGNSSDNGNYVPPGFYRVYVRADDILMWLDVFIFDECEDIPVGMRSFLRFGCY